MSASTNRRRCPAHAVFTSHLPEETGISLSIPKEALWSNLETPSLRAGIDLENRNQILAAQTEDSKAAMAGFLSKHIPDWKNR